MGPCDRRRGTAWAPTTSAGSWRRPSGSRWGAAGRGHSPPAADDRHPTRGKEEDFRLFLTLARREGPVRGQEQGYGRYEWDHAPHGQGGSTHLRGQGPDRRTQDFFVTHNEVMTGKNAIPVSASLSSTLTPAARNTTTSATSRTTSPPPISATSTLPTSAATGTGCGPRQGSVLIHSPRHRADADQAGALSTEH